MIFIAALLLASQPAHAGNQRSEKQISCSYVRMVVATVGASRAEQMARAAGANDAQIAKAKRCLS